MISRTGKVVLLIVLILVLDQALKIWVKTHMSYGEEIAVFGLSWFRLHFVENNGMAFGLQFGGASGKLALSLFRLLAVGVLIYYLGHLIRARASTGILVSFALILGGAIGNIIDSAFYGLLFSESGFHSGVAEFLPSDGGYASLFHGKVVDMLYLPVWAGNLPEWVPFAGGRYTQLFKPVFNLADVAITLGVLQVVFLHSTTMGKTGLPPENESRASIDGTVSPEQWEPAHGPSAAREEEGGSPPSSTDDLPRSLRDKTE